MNERWIRKLPSKLDRDGVALTDLGPSVLPAPDLPEELSLHSGVCWWRGPADAHRLRLVGAWSFFRLADLWLGFHEQAESQMSGDTVALRPRSRPAGADLPYGATASPHRWSVGEVDLWCDAGFAYLRVGLNGQVLCLGRAKKGLPGPNGSFIAVEPQLRVSCAGARALCDVEAPVEAPFVWEPSGQAVWGLVGGEPVRVCASTGSVTHAEANLWSPPPKAIGGRCFADGIRCEATLREDSVLHRWTREGARLSERYSSEDTGPS